jgi:hypothetical protein
VGWTYTASLAKSQALHWVRLRIGDTDTTKQLLENEEIDAALTDWGLTTVSDPTANRVAVRRAARDCCLAIAGRKASETELALSDVSGPKRTAADIFRSLAADLQKEADAIERGGFIEQHAPHEEIDAMDYRVTRHGGDASEYVGDVV